MIVYNLACDAGHPFEGWFASPADFENQRDRGLVSCPLCSSKAITRQLHAPRLNLGAAGASAAADAGVDAAAVDDAMLRLAEFAKHVRAHSDDVGTRFADEARAMHYGEKERREIRGRVERAVADELREEGIEVLALPFPLEPPSGTH